ncbi:MAG: ribosome biogenesis GTPase Der [Gammaproteobacteria bacterium]
MTRVLAIIGRANVGKSTLFNQLTRSRDALVADTPGITRDRIVGHGTFGERRYLCVDTGGLGDDPEGLGALVRDQALRAAAEADVVLFVVDGRAGMAAGDRDIARRLRRLGKPVRIAVNKTEGLDPETAVAEFFDLGLGTPIAISSAHREGLVALLESALGHTPADPAQGDPNQADPIPDAGTRVAVVGRPNVGKSTLVNRMLGEERVVVYDRPGTTRDSVAVPFVRHGRPYVLIDTAGMRRRARVHEAVEHFSVVKTQQAIDRAHVVVVVLDAGESISEQDAALLGMVIEAGRALVVAVNKWDGLHPEQRDHVHKEVDRRLTFLDFARVHYLSALHGSGVGGLYASIDRAHASAFVEVQTGALTRILERAVLDHPPPLVAGRRIKLRYAHLGGHNPPRVVVHGHRSASLPEPYRRYLERALREALGIEGTPLRVELRQDANPYINRPSGNRPSGNKPSGNRPAGQTPPVNKPRPAPRRKRMPDHAV